MRKIEYLLHVIPQETRRQDGSMVQRTTDAGLPLWLLTVYEYVGGGWEVLDMFEGPVDGLKNFVSPEYLAQGAIQIDYTDFVDYGEEWLEGNEMFGPREKGQPTRAATRIVKTLPKDREAAIQLLVECSKESRPAFNYLDPEVFPQEIINTVFEGKLKPFEGHQLSHELSTGEVLTIMKIKGTVKMEVHDGKGRVWNFDFNRGLFGRTW